ncbi:MAG: hypothetical protein HKN16_06630, partial [Saprospiraceae bacterium]|nr:hypothetical protein [Saprospiraceae bacterium]
MPKLYNSVSWRGLSLFIAFLFFSISIVAQTISLPEGMKGVRERMEAKSVGEIFTVDNLSVGEFYMLNLNSQEGCLPTLELVDPDAGILTLEETTGNFQANRERIQFRIKDFGCKKQRANFVISLNCWTCPIDEPSTLGSARLPNLVVDGSWSAQALIEQVFIGGGCFDIQNVSAAGSYGYFSSGASSVGFNEGIILSTGNVATAPGPNNSEGTSGSAQGGSDPDLAAITTNTVFDYTVIEFDFTPTINNVSFSYSFASEEYCEWVNSGFNDVFGFFISGPGLSGGFTNDGVNIAVLPSGQSITINTVNNTLNSGLFVPSSSSCGATPNPDISFDGFTVPLGVFSEVQVCETYHIRLLIGDAGDSIFDSAVFLGGETFKAGGLGTMAAQIPGLTPDFQGVALEDCGDGFLVFNTIGGPAEESFEIPISINPASTATDGLDFTSLPTSILIPEGQATVLIPFTIFQDFITEGLETLIIDLDSPCSCSITQFTININDNVPLSAVDEVFDFCAEESVTLTAQPMGGAPPFTYSWSANGESTPSIGVTPVETTTYTVTISDDCGNDVISNHTVNVAATITASMSGQFDICGEFDQVDIPVVFQGPGPWTLGYAFNAVPQPPITNIFDNPYTLTVTEVGVYDLLTIMSGGCNGAASGSVIISQGELTYVADLTNLSCSGNNDGEIFLTPFGGAGGYSYQWTGTSNQSNNPTGLGPGEYFVTMTDAVGCSAETSYTLTQPLPPVVQSVVVVDADCYDPLGSIDITVTPTTSNGPIVINWDQGVGQVEDPSGLVPNTYTATITDDAGCVVQQPATIQGFFDPPGIVADVSGDLTCAQPQVDLTGVGSDSGPNISYEWFDGGGTLISNDLTISTNVPDIFNFVVTNSDNGCTAELPVFVNQDIVDPISAIINPGELNCLVSEVTLDGSGSSGSNAIDLEWSLGGFPIGAAQTQLANTPGNYTLLVTDQVNGCTDEVDAFVVQDINPPSSDAGPDGTLTCTLDQFVLSGTGNSSSGQFDYSWEDSNGDQIAITPTVTV